MRREIANLTGELGAKIAEFEAVERDRNQLLNDLRRSEADHAATHEDLRHMSSSNVSLQTLINELRNQMISQGMLREEQTARMQRLEGYIDRVREIDSLVHLGIQPAEDRGPDAI